MRRLLAALALAALAFVPAAAGDVSGYSHPLNVGGKDPFGLIPDVEADRITFRPTHPFHEFSVEARDHVGFNTWMRVCVRISGLCIGQGEGPERVVVTAQEGIFWPATATVDVYVYSAHVWADGEVDIGTWGGVRARFAPDPQVDDIVPYAAAGYAGLLPLGIPVDLRVECGYLVSAQCSTIPFAAKTIRATLIDDVSADPHFEMCATTASGAEIRCVPATRTGTLVAPTPAGFPVGGEVDIRPYITIGNKLVGTKGHAIIQYS